MADVTTVIGDSIHLRGNLQGDEDLTVLGRVEGTIELSRTLIIEQSGVVKADVSVKNAIISGVVVGNITAEDSVEITREGRMVGDISAPRVILVDGASFKGQVDMGNLDLPRAPSMGEARPKPVASRTSLPSRASRAEPEPEIEAEVEEPRREAARPSPRPAPRSEPPKREPVRSEPPKREPARPAPKPEPPKAAAKTTKKADTAPPKPKVMQSKKRKVSVRKR